MNRGIVLQALAIVIAAAVGGAHAVAATPRAKPNIVFFLVDDMGWMDTTVNGSRYYETPNMERLAKGGMVFRDAYAASPLCSPTRASLMTGKYPARTRVTIASGHRPADPPGTPLHAPNPARRRDKPMLLPRTKVFIDREEYTIAEALRDAGYRTAHLGKWHLGLDPQYWPEEQGFEVSFHGAPDPGPPSYFPPYRFKAGTVTDGPKGEYIVDRVTDEALKFIDAHRSEPFFLNVWQYGVHGPWGHKETYTRQFVGKKDPRGKQGNPIMASMLKSIDESLGRILDKLDELGLADDTIVIFFSDNGGEHIANSDKDSKVAAVKPGHNAWPRIQEWRKYAGSQPPTNNAPLRMGKGTIYEGGVRVPCTMRWPGIVRPGTHCDDVVSSVDFYPTLLEMAGIAERVQKPLDGESIVPLLKQSGKMRREAVFCYFPHDNTRAPPGVAVRKGDWKLIRWFETAGDYPNFHELYNLKDDLGETKNLASQNPEKVQEIDRLIDKHFADTHAVLPIPNPDAGGDGKKLNVLMIAVDDLRPELGCYGRKAVHSPHIDRLAADGTRFARAYCQYPVCSPSRSSLLTGLRPTKDRFVLNLPTTVRTDAPGAVTLPEIFKRHGYYTISNGKIFHGYDKPVADRSWSEKPWSKGGAWVDPDSKNYTHPKTGRGPFFEAADVTDEMYPDGKIAEKTIRDLRRLKKMDKPFFLACGFFKPHLPFNAPKKYWDLYPRESVKLADNRFRPHGAPDALVGSHELTTYYHLRGLEYNSDEFHTVGRRGYHACVSYTDAQVGKVLAELDKLGLRDNTIVILWGDHGWHVGEHDFWGKATNMHDALNAPLIVSAPGMKPNQTCDRLVEFVDIYPTLCELAGITTGDKLEGTSFVPLLKEPNRQWKAAVFARCDNNKADRIFGETVITERHTYTEYQTHGGKSERMLYDLNADPRENENISEKPENAKLVKRMSDTLDRGWKAARP